MASVISQSKIPGFAGISLVHMADGSKKHINQLKKGDTVDTPLGPATVERLVAFSLHESKIAKIGVKLWVTPYFPILYGSEWKYIQEIKGVEIVDCSAKRIYNVVLSKHHVMIVGGMTCATFGNQFKDIKVVQSYRETTQNLQERILDH